MTRLSAVPVRKVAALLTGAAVGGAAAFVVARVLGAMSNGFGAFGTGHGMDGPGPLGPGAVILIVVGVVCGFGVVERVTAKSTWGGPHVPILVLIGGPLGLLGISAAVVYLSSAHDRSVACQRAVDEIRHLGFGLEIRWDSPLRTQDGCREPLARLMRDQTASPEAQLAAGLALLQFSDRAGDFQAEVGTLFTPPHAGRLAAMESLANPHVVYTDYRVDRLTIAGWIDRALADPDPAVVLAAWWVSPNWIWVRPATDRVCGLSERFAGHDDAKVRARTLEGQYLEPCDFDLQIARVERGLRDRDAEVRRAAVAAAASLEVRSLPKRDPAPARVARRLAPFLGDPDVAVRRTALRYLRLHGDPQGRELLSTVMRCPSQPDAVRQDAAELLAALLAGRNLVRETDPSKVGDWRAAGREHPARAGTAGCPIVENGAGGDRSKP